MSAPSSIFEVARLRLARMTVEGAAELTRGFGQAAAASARALNVARVGVWFISDDASKLICASQFELDGAKHSAGAELRLESLPAYAAALNSRRVVLASDARTSQDTRELCEEYLDVHGITSMLDAPIFRHGEVVGVVCHEHIGPKREWTLRERDFAASVADLLAVLLEQATRMDMEAALGAQRERLAGLERMEALARLGAGVAHDFNNILTAITLNIDYLRQQYQSDFVLSQALGELLDIGERGQRIAQQLLTFSKVKAHSPRSLNITRAVKEMRTALTALLGENYRLELDVTDETVAVHADPSQLDQVLINLVINARDAMPEGGRVRVKLSATSDMAILSISDDGVGIEPSALGRIFEPFFTTKGHGTGLGLSIVHSIVEQNGGTIAVASEAGATFIIRIPRTG